MRKNEIEQKENPFDPTEKKKRLVFKIKASKVRAQREHEGSARASRFIIGVGDAPR